MPMKPEDDQGATSPPLVTEEQFPLRPEQLLSLRFTRCWHTREPLKSALSLDSVNLGEVLEYALYPHVEKVFSEHHARKTP